ncbi:MAG: DUF4097 domain-containing protein [Pleurocapsa minor GSE-CHR-MK-17-07R]|jgi:hypothetical protein|nr:DUF4097 domain-containing protein [Pleurocapsa minor GSE-CHR-MK 17-07R]
MLKISTITGTAALTGLMLLAGCGNLVASPRATAYTEIRGSAQSLEITLSPDRSDIVLSALSAGDALMTAELQHLGDLSYGVSGDEQRVITIDEAPVMNVTYTGPSMRWLVALDPSMPLTITTNVGSGDTTLPLETFIVNGLTANVGSGDVDISLPSGEAAIPVSINTGSGNVSLDTADGSQLSLETINLGSGNFRLDSGASASYTGSIAVESGDVALNLANDNSGALRVVIDSGDARISLPDGVALRVEVTIASGDINAGNRMQRVSGGETLTGNSGVWETAGFADAEQQFTVTLTIDSGDLTIE